MPINVDQGSMTVRKGTLSPKSSKTIPMDTMLIVFEAGDVQWRKFYPKDPSVWTTICLHAIEDFEFHEMELPASWQSSPISV